MFAGTAGCGSSSTASGSAGAGGISEAAGSLGGAALGGSDPSGGGNASRAGAAGTKDGLGGTSTSIAGASSGGTESAGAAGAAPGESGGSSNMGGNGGATNSCHPRVLLLLDRSASMKEPSSTPALTRWQLVIPPLDDLLASAPTSIDWGLKVFPEGEGAECSPLSNAIALPIGAGNAAAMVTTVDSVLPTGNGTPTDSAVNLGANYLRQLDGSAPTYLLLITDGVPNCAGTTLDSTAARSAAITAIGNAAASGFHTFVIGIETSSAVAKATLDAMAIAGLEPRDAANPTDARFYPAKSPDDTKAALDAILGRLRCP
jgi:hypothetical protein